MGASRDGSMADASGSAPQQAGAASSADVSEAQNPAPSFLSTRHPSVIRARSSKHDMTAIPVKEPCNYRI